MNDMSGPASPITLEMLQQEYKGHGRMTGMSLRDYFAGQAIVGWGGGSTTGLSKRPHSSPTPFTPPATPMRSQTP